MRKENREIQRIDYYCDLCEEKFADSWESGRPEDVSVERGVTINLPVVEDGDISFKVVDLCGDCTSDLSRWLLRRVGGVKKGFLGWFTSLFSR